jgi:carbonic anhydrase/acetyltransferase-like protein (isoleucine patch superfamily)
MIYALDGIVPDIDPDTWIADTAVVIGRVRLAAQVSVWFGAVLRGDGEPIVVGQGSNIQESCTLHTDAGFPLTIGRDVTVGHNVILHGCTIEDGALIGMGATVLNGAVIGAGSLVGAGALVTEGKVIPPGSLVMGAPARVVRPIDEAQRDRLRLSAAHYRQRLAQFRAGLTRIG